MEKWRRGEKCKLSKYTAGLININSSSDLVKGQNFIALPLTAINGVVVALDSTGREFILSVPHQKALDILRTGFSQEELKLMSEQSFIPTDLKLVAVLHRDHKVKPFLECYFKDETEKALLPGKRGGQIERKVINCCDDQITRFDLPTTNHNGTQSKWICITAPDRFQFSLFTKSLPRRLPSIN